MGWEFYIFDCLTRSLISSSSSLSAPWCDTWRIKCSINSQWPVPALLWCEMVDGLHLDQLSQHPQKDFCSAQQSATENGYLKNEEASRNISVAFYRRCLIIQNRSTFHNYHSQQTPKVPIKTRRSFKANIR